MSFGRFCDGYLVLHAPHLSPERLPLVKNELERVGVDKYSIRQPEVVTEEELARSKYQRAATLSVLKSLVSCIEFARQSEWRRFIFMEDDVQFRTNFSRLWPSVEASLEGKDWGLLTLFRWPTVPGEYIVKERFFAPAEAVAIRHNICGHAIIIQSNFYETVIEALNLCVNNGWPADFMYGILTGTHYGQVLATNKNLAGQRGGLVSLVQERYKRNLSHYASFRSSITSLDYHLVNMAMRLLR